MQEAPQVNNLPPEVTDANLRDVNHPANSQRHTKRAFVLLLFTEYRRQEDQDDLMTKDEATQV